ncbi:unnamed protein product [Rotaria sp. Silwood2]|nr:unnamed protein product [Rotaria sp. Silwood2]CAF4583082.1 unnamed protein product [Rotaria sp. Silwood2]
MQYILIFMKKISLNYRGSLLYTITFSFLPVYRLACITDVLRNNENIQTCSNLQRIHGERCEIVDNKIILSFRKDIVLSQSIFIHFIEIINNGTPIRATTFRTIPFTQDSFIVYWSLPFHLVYRIY